MNKTVNINISGIVFHIEEDAYNRLSNYLSAIKSYFNKTDGDIEIMSDIEARIAEMLQSKISAYKQVVLMSDIDFVIENMGKPEDFAEETYDNTSQFQTNETNEYNEPIKKRLFRDGDNKALGGVCSGIGNYFDFDAVWLRIAFLVFFFFFGTGLLLYIILWIAMPEAKTTAEKLAMKGKKIDINTISKTVKEEADQLKKRVEKYGENLKNNTYSNNAPKNLTEKIIDFITALLFNIGRAFLKIIGIIMVIFGILFFLGLVSSILGISFITNEIDGQQLIDLLLLDGQDFYLGLIGIAIFIGTPIVMMIYGGIKLIFKIHYTNRWINFAAGIFWFIGLVLILYVGIRTGNDFSKTAKIRENIRVNEYNTLYLKMKKVESNAEEKSNDGDDNDDDLINFSSKNNGFKIGIDKNGRYLLGKAQLNIIKSQTNTIDLLIIKEAMGANKQLASLRAKNISYTISQTDSLIEFDDVFKVTNADKYRAQDLSIILKLPVGKIIYIDESLEKLIYDIENTTNTYDGDMINRRWMMSENGLKCIDCDGLSNDDNKIESSKNININVNGVNINSKDAVINVDSNGIKINSKKSNVTIDKNGVHVDNKTK